MTEIELVPYERDKKSAEMYKFMHWFIRVHKKEIMNNVRTALLQLTLYGNVDWDKFAEV